MNDSHPFHICIATEQNVVNLIPAIQCGAHEVWILETPSMAKRQSGQNLKHALRNRKIKSEIRPFPQDNPADIREATITLAGDIDKLGRRPTINITGGTKPMALALVQELANLLNGSSATKPDIVYTNTRTQQLEWLSPKPVLQPMDATLRINDILRVYGYEHDSSRNTGSSHDAWLGAALDRFEATQQIARDIAQGMKLKSLSNLAGKASDAVASADKGKKFQPHWSLDSVADKSMNDYLDLLSQHGLLDCASGYDIEFRNVEAARYCAGGWLEEFVAVQADSIKQFGLPIRGDWRANVFPKSRQNEILNEIDLMVAHNNRALIVECKAAQLADDKVNDWLSKLDDTARRVAGTQAGRLLVSARQLTDMQQDRARLMGIGTCSGADLAHFSRYLQYWMKTGNFRDVDSG